MDRQIGYHIGAKKVCNFLESFFPHDHDWHRENTSALIQWISHQKSHNEKYFCSRALPFGFYWWGDPILFGKLIESSSRHRQGVLCSDWKLMHKNWGMDENRRVSAKRTDHREILIEQQRNRLVSSLCLTNSHQKCNTFELPGAAWALLCWCFNFPRWLSKRFDGSLLALPHVSTKEIPFRRDIPLCNCGYLCSLLLHHNSEEWLGFALCSLRESSSRKTMPLSSKTLVHSKPFCPVLWLVVCIFAPESLVALCEEQRKREEALKKRPTFGFLVLSGKHGIGLHRKYYDNFVPCLNYGKNHEIFSLCSLHVFFLRKIKRALAFS